MNSNFEWGDDVNCNVQQKTDVISSMADYMTSMSGAFSYTETKEDESNVNVPLWPISLLISYKETKAKESSTSESSSYEKQKNRKSSLKQ